MLLNNVWKASAPFDPAKLLSTQLVDATLRGNLLQQIHAQAPSSMIDF